MNKTLIFSATKKDFRIDTFRCPGKGGQNVNKRDTGVRLTHIESGLSAKSVEFRTQEQNKKAAFHKLVDKLVDFYCRAPEKERNEAGSKVIRTYNECTDMVKDHDTGKKYSYRKTIGKGDMNVIIEERSRDLK
jgi:protein subunit release factor A